MAQLLVQNGVALTAVSESKLNKLTTFAIKKNRVQMTQLLLQNGATLTVEDASALLNKAIINQYF